MSIIRKMEFLYGKAFDNRLGCVSIIDTMQALRDEADQLGSGSGRRIWPRRKWVPGATVTAQQVQPDLAIVFEGITGG